MRDGNRGGDWRPNLFRNSGSGSGPGESRRWDFSPNFEVKNKRERPLPIPA